MGNNTYIFDTSVPWWATITLACADEYPTYPVQKGQHTILNPYPNWLTVLDRSAVTARGYGLEVRVDRALGTTVPGEGLRGLAVCHRGIVGERLVRRDLRSRQS